jgi:hypothetical protein
MGLPLVLIVTGCGAGGYPSAPSESPISISGETRIGVTTHEGNVAETDLTINFGV